MRVYTLCISPSRAGWGNGDGEGKQKWKRKAKAATSFKSSQEPALEAARGRSISALISVNYGRASPSYNYKTIIHGTWSYTQLKHTPPYLNPAARLKVNYSSHKFKGQIFPQDVVTQNGSASRSAVSFVQGWVRPCPAQCLTHSPKFRYHNI